MERLVSLSGSLKAVQPDPVGRVRDRQALPVPAADGHPGGGGDDFARLGNDLGRGGEVRKVVGVARGCSLFARRL